MAIEGLRKFGWDDKWEKAFREYGEKGLLPARVSFQNQHVYRLYMEDGEIAAEIAGRLRYEAESNADLPAVGDWVAVKPGVGRDGMRIHAVLPRRTQFARKTVGAKTEAQIVGANVDVVLLVTSMNQDFNPRRIERYLANAWDTGAEPVVVLSKADLCEEPEKLLVEARAAAPGVAVHMISIRTGDGVAGVLEHFGEGRTVALVGTSGVGKSSLINFILGEERQAVNAVREHDDRGQHTTRHRELIVLAGGGLVLDTPGMRELQLWEAESGVSGTFEDVEELAAACFFSDCKHETEPRCAVREAVEKGELDAQRLASYLKLNEEIKQLSERREEYQKKLEQKGKRKLHRAVKEISSRKRSGS